MTKTPLLKDVPDLFPLVFDDDRETAEEAVSVIQGVVKDIAPLQWVPLDIASRSWRVNVPAAFAALQPVDLARLGRFQDAQTLLVGLASFHHNGYVRQAAISQLAASDGGEELPFLLLRLNDWVPQVSEPAWAACTERLRPDYAPHYAANLPLVLALAGPRRHDFTSFISAVTGLLRRPALLTGMAASDQSVRRACARLALDSVDEDASDIFEAALGSRDGFVRFMAARALRRRPAGDAVQAAFAPRLGRDRLPTIRREFLYLCHEKLPGAAPAALRAALLDGNASVRATARYYQQFWEPMDLRAFYLAALDVADVPGLPAAIAGVGETGLKEDTHGLETFLHGPSARVCAAAVTALNLLGGDDSIPLMLEAVNDRRTAVSRAALEALIRRSFSVDENALWAAYVRAGTGYAARGLLRLMKALPKWPAGLLLIKAHIHQTQPEGAAETAAALRSWLARTNQGFVAPTSDQREEWRLLLNRHQARFDPQLLARLRASL